jgi:hypothetical protein
MPVKRARVFQNVVAGSRLRRCRASSAAPKRERMAAPALAGGCRAEYRYCVDVGDAGANGCCGCSAEIDS